MSKITKKMMNTIHNEMRKRFTPSWERQQRVIRELEDRIYNLENPPNKTKPVIIEKVPAVIPQPSDEAKHRAVTTATTTVRVVIGAARNGARIFINYDKYKQLTEAGVQVIVLNSALSAKRGTEVYVQFLPTVVYASKVAELRKTLHKILGFEIELSVKEV